MIKSKSFFKKLFDEHKDMVAGVIFNIAGHHYNEELVQETFIKVWRALPSFSFKSSYKTWIYRIAINTAYDHVRKKEIIPNESAEQSLDNEYSRLENEELVAYALEQLSKEERALVTLRYFEELSYKEISDVMELNINNVKSKVIRAKEKMQKYLIKQGVEL